MSGLVKELKPLLVTFAALVVLTGVVYPLAAFVIGQLAFPYQANGSLLKDSNGTVVGSELIGQQFTGDRYFWPRPSSTSGFPYNPLASGGSNLGPTNAKLIGDIRNRTQLIRQANGAGAVPSDLVMSSASGLDPDISLDAALLQVPRVAKARGLDASSIERLVRDRAEKPLLGVAGADTVNVLTLNLALDKM
ncbi:MAG TPA: K(+)-transporting ATPase subunit C [Methanocella sp.]|nr:K(+)-transporting ATPase subunit C [Methanocella sp.]